MARCELGISFDRPDREYQAGERVTGSVTVRADADVKCRALTVVYNWRTHGKGNKDSGPERAVLRAEHVTLRAGATATYPFDLTAPRDPPTYRGHYLNIDHYLRARADIPWALDAKSTEEFIVLPRAGGPRGRARPKPFEENFWKWIRNVIAKNKLGAVSAQLGVSAAAPGQRVPVRIRFRPQQSEVQLNCITARLVGKERCVSGSGTNKTTHTHTLYEHTEIMAASSAPMGGDAVVVDGALPVPDTAAYSFKSKSNAVIWTVSLRVDVAEWPDWVQSTTLEIRPHAPTIDVAKAAVTAATPPGPDVAPLEPEVLSTPTEPLPSETDEGSPRPGPAADLDAAPPVPTPPPPPDPFTKAIEGVTAADRFTGDRERLVGELAGHPFGFAVHVDRVDWTHGFDVAEPYRDGRTVIGDLTIGKSSVLMRFSGADNESIDKVKPGMELRVTGLFAKWDNVYNRPEIDVTSFEVEDD